MQGGPRRGRSPITGPALPRAAQASQLRRTARIRARRAECIEIFDFKERQREFVLCSRGKSLSAAFTQTRLFRPDCVKILFLMLTYLSTLRSKTGFFLVRPKNAYFANSPNTSHRLRSAAASLRKATPRPASDDGRLGEKAGSCLELQGMVVSGEVWLVWGSLGKYKESLFLVSGARACQPHLRKPDFFGLTALKSCF